MEYWVSNTDDSLIFNSGPCHDYKMRSHSAKSNIPLRISILEDTLWKSEPVEQTQVFVEFGNENRLYLFIINPTG